MALVLKDRVKQAAAAPGTGTITLGATTAGFQSFASVGNGNTTYFAIVDPVSGDWEVNYGTYTSSGTTLTRNSTPLSSSNSGSLVNFTGAVDVFLTYPSEKAVWQDTSGVVAQQSFGAITATSAALTTGTVSTTPAANTDIANKQYVDGLVTQGISYHEPVYVESPNTAGNLNALYNQPGGAGNGVGATLTNNGTKAALTIDGILMTTTKRVLIYNQTNAFENGVYTVTTVGTPDPGGTNWVLTRSTDADTYGLRDPDSLGYNDAFFVTNGDTGAGETYVCTTTGTITFGTTNITFAQISSAQVYTAGTGLNLSPATTFNISNTGVSASTYGSASAVPVFAVNAQGQLTSVTNTNIAINGSQVSGNISGSAGSVANALTLGTYLTGGTYNGSAAVTATVDATSANTASKVVARDSSGNFSAGTITATLNGTATSTASATNLSGGAANQIAYQSATNTTAFATAPSASNQVLNWNGSAFTWSAGTISGVPLGSNLNSLTAGSYLTGTAYNGSAAQTWTVDATSANTASKVVARDASGNFSAGTITAALSGNALTATTATNQSGGTVNATTGAFSGLLTVQQNSTTAVQIATGYYIGMGDWGMRNTTPNGYIQFGPANSSYAHIYTDRPNFYFNTDILVNDNLVLTSGNYNSYAPTLTGTGASGTWNINITGSAGSAPGYLPLSGGTMTGTIVGATNSIVIGQLSGTTYGYLYQDSNGFGLLGNSGSWAARVDYGTLNTSFFGVAQSNVDMRAPIFYDSNNTAYYVDPAGTTSGSFFGFVGIGNNYGTDDGGWGSRLNVGGTNYGRIDARCAADGIVTTMYSHVGQGLGKVGTMSNHPLALMAQEGNTGGYVYNGSIRAPIFYDSDNTAYYVDPNAGTSANFLGSVNAATYNFAGLLVNASGSASTGSSIAIQQVTAEGWTGIFVDYEPNAGWGLYHDNPNNYFCYTAESSTGSFRSFVVPSRYSGNRTAYEKFRVDQNNGDILVGGISYAYGSSRSPIFYDYDNTAYYGDFASTSVLSNLIVNYTAASGSTATPAVNIRKGWTGMTTVIYDTVAIQSNDVATIRVGEQDGTTGGYCQGDGYNTFTSTSPMRFYTGGSATGYIYSGMGGTLGLYVDNGSTRAPIFYDSDNTSYYVDPASTSNFVQINLQGILRRNTSAAGYLEGNYPTGVNSSSSAAIYTIGGSYQPTSTTLGNMYGIGYTIGNSAGMGFVGNWGMYVASNGTARIFLDSDAGVGYATGSFRAPIFYDYNDTGYYVDPNGTSQFSRVEANYSIEMRSSAGGGYPAFLVNQFADVTIYRAGGQTAYIGFSNDNVAYLYNDGTNFIFSGRGLQATSFGVGTAPSGTTGEIRATNNITAYYSSDIKFKTNVRDIPNALEIAESIGGKLFDWTDEYIEEHGGEDGYFIQKEDFGVIAQDVLKVFPVAVRTRPDGSLAVDYEKLSAVAFAAVASLSTRVKSLEARI